MNNDEYWYFFFIENEDNERKMLTIPCLTEDCVKDFFDSRNIPYNQGVPGFKGKDYLYIIDVYSSLESFKKDFISYKEMYVNTKFIPYKLKKKYRDISSRIIVSEEEMMK